MASLSRRIVLLVLSVVLIMQAGAFSASAERAVYATLYNTDEVSTAINSDGLTVFGYFGDKSGYPVTIMIKDAEQGTVACLNQVMTQEDGYYSALFPYDAAMVGKTCTVTVTSPVDTVLHEKTLVYQPGVDADTLGGLLSSADTAEEMQSFLEEYGTDAGVSMAALNNLTAPEIVYEELSGQSYSSIEDFRKSFKAAVDAQEQNSAAVHEIHVAPDGSDINAATEDSPLATIEAALTYADYLMAMGSEENFEILLHGGEYPVDSDIVIEKEPSRHNHIAIRNYNEEQPILNGSRPITGWEPYQGNIYRAKVARGLDIHVLYENRNMLTKARYPNKGTTPQQMLEEYLQIDTYNNSKRQFLYREGDLPEMANTADLEVGIFAGSAAGYFMWQMNVIKVDAIDTATRLITLNSDAHYEIGTTPESGIGSLYYLQGALELLDAPGEFYHDTSAGYLYYYPTDGEIEGKTVSYPVVNNMLTIANSDGTKISGITIDGIGICGTKRNEKVYMNTNNPGGNRNGNGVLIQNAKNVKVTNCEIFGVSGNGIAAENHLQDCVFSGNHLSGNGEAGIIITGTESHVTKNNTIDNNYVHHQGLIVHSKSGIGMAAYHADGNVISHNRLHDLKRCGILLSHADGDNVIEYNDISATCNGTDDAGMIYTMLTTGVTTIRHNYVHDSYSEGSYRGIYLDEGSHNSIVENNLITRLAGRTYGAMLAKGSDIQIVNNYMVDIPNLADAAIVTYMKSQPTERMVIEKNIVYNYPENARLYTHHFAADSTQRLKSSDKNLFYKSVGGYTMKYHNTYYTLDTYREMLGFEANSKTEDPLFISTSGGNARFSYLSPAIELGIEALELDKMGLRAGFCYGNPDEKPANVFVRAANSNVNEGFVKVRVGEKVSLGTLVRNQNGFVIPSDAVTLTYTTAAQDGVAVLGSNGLVTGLKEGIVRAKIKAQTAEGTAESEFDIVVSADSREDSVVSVQRLVVKNQSGEVLTELESGKLEVALSLMADSDTATRVIVSYVDKEGVLQACSVAENAALTKGVLVDIPGEITIPADATGHLYVFIWKNLDTLQPIFDKIMVF